MKLNDILDEWDKDSELNQLELSQASLNIPKLHGKYLRYMAIESIVYDNLDMEYKKLYAQKHQWFDGVLDTDKQKELGWEPQPKQILKANIQMLIDAEDDIQTIKRKMSTQKQKISSLSEILKSLAFRNSTIKNAIDVKKIENGMNW